MCPELVVPRAHRGAGGRSVHEAREVRKPEDPPGETLPARPAPQRKRPREFPGAFVRKSDSQDLRVVLEAGDDAVAVAPCVETGDVAGHDRDVRLLMAL